MNESDQHSLELSAGVPRHVAVIMDGNGRWASNKGLPRLEGHRKGVDAVRCCVDAARNSGVEYLTLFAFSSENWSRPSEEVFGLMQLMRHYLKSETAKLNDSGIQVRVVGDLDRLEPDLQVMIEQACTLTSENTGFVVTFAISYGGRADIVQAVQKIATEVQSSTLNVADITETLVESALMTAGMPDPDLVIRTSGEQRLSNFLMWQLAYAEIYFTPVFWPDFSAEDFKAALAHYKNRDRRYGGLKETSDQQRQGEG